MKITCHCILEALNTKCLRKSDFINLLPVITKCAPHDLSRYKNTALLISVIEFDSEDKTNGGKLIDVRNEGRKCFI